MSDLIEFAEQIESWHSNKVSNLQNVIENIKEGITLKIDESGEEVELDKKQALFFKLGLVSALGEFEELPFKLSKNGS